MPGKKTRIILLLKLLKLNFKKCKKSEIGCRKGMHDARPIPNTTKISSGES